MFYASPDILEHSSLPSNVFNKHSNQQPTANSHTLSPLQILVILRFRKLHSGVLPQEPLHSLDREILVVVDPFGLLFAVLRPWIVPNRREIRDLRRLVRELVAIDEGLIEREVLHLLVVLCEREEVHLRLNALRTSLRLISLLPNSQRPRKAPSRPSRGPARLAPTSAARFSALKPRVHAYIDVRVVVQRRGKTLGDKQTS